MSTALVTEVTVLWSLLVREAADLSLLNWCGRGRRSVSCTGHRGRRSFTSTGGKRDRRSVSSGGERGQKYLSFVRVIEIVITVIWEVLRPLLASLRPGLHHSDAREIRSSCSTGSSSSNSSNMGTVLSFSPR